VGRLALFGLIATALAAAVIAQADTPATGATDSGAPPPSSAPVAAKADPVICEWEDDIGSLLGGHKVCMTKSQWQRDAADSRDQLNDTTKRAYRMGTPGH
jgi:hypothetical protein